MNLWAGRAPALLAMILAAVMPTVVFYDTWVRMYAPFSTIELLGWYLLSIAVARPDLAVARRRALWCGWLLCTVASAYLLYLAMFVLAAQLLWIAIANRSALVEAAGGAGRRVGTSPPPRA